MAIPALRKSCMPAFLGSKPVSQSSSFQFVRTPYNSHNKGSSRCSGISGKSLRQIAAGSCPTQAADRFITHIPEIVRSVNCTSPVSTARTVPFSEIAVTSAERRIPFNSRSKTGFVKKCTNAGFGALQ